MTAKLLYHFNNDALDSSGNGDHLSIAGSPTYATDISSFVGDGLFHHISLVKTSFTVKLFIDGTLVQTASVVHNDLLAGSLYINSRKSSTRQWYRRFFWNYRRIKNFKYSSLYNNFFTTYSRIYNRSTFNAN